MIDRTIRYGQSFNRLAARILRQIRNNNEQRMFDPDQIQRILDEADPVMKAMVLLALNGAFGNTDIANLPQAYQNRVARCRTDLS